MITGPPDEHYVEIIEKGEISMEVKKVLWPTDFSNSSEKALPYVTSLTQKYQAEIHVLYVIEDIAHHESWYGDFDHVDKLMEWAQKSATKRLEQVCEKYLEGCPLYIKHISVGDPAQEILKLIDSEKVDMVVMASHGEKGHFRFGSVTEKVVKNSPIPVTTIPIEAQ
jgi:nucleotide-binding universal stress UspA family protein